MNLNILNSTARDLVKSGKGILAADESTGTIEKRFKSIDVANTEPNRQAYREMLLDAQGLENYISGVIFYDETLRQSSKKGEKFPDLLKRKGIIPGIKVDAGIHDLPGHPEEKVTEGLDGLRKRLTEYKALGARFAKWRAVYSISATLPSAACIRANAEGLARYAALCQEQDIVPIVEPEILMDGTHTIERCEQVFNEVLPEVFSALRIHGVALEGILLKPGMVISGKECPKQASSKEVAEATLRTFRRHVPGAVPGIVFLSGGQSSVTATENLNAINACGPQPWPLSYSYGRALQDDALKAWKGQSANEGAGRNALLLRSKCNSAASQGKYSGSLEKAAAG
ncbi:MAG: class I fructose-bisphosphate aldolase [Planctomycetota bacterium]